jgi:hypothetical protein
MAQTINGYIANLNNMSSLKTLTLSIADRVLPTHPFVAS